MRDSLFPSAYLPATGPVQDGGMSGHNNLIKLALWKSLRMNPSLSKPDVVVSVSTGTWKNSVSSRSTSFCHVLFDGCIPWLLHAYMFFFDEKSNFRDVVNNLDKESCDDYKRLNIFLPINEPGIDNTSQMHKLRESVHQNPQLMGNCQMTVYALLITTFYFELNGLLRNLSEDRFQCFEMICCRLSNKAIVEVLEQVHPSQLTFVTNTRTLGYYNERRNLCPMCQRYWKNIEFSIRNMSQLTSIGVRSSKQPQWKISAFSKTMQWFIDRQGLNTSFETAYHKNLWSHSCKLCLMNGSYSSLKRQASACEGGTSSHKRPWLS